MKERLPYFIEFAKNLIEQNYSMIELVDMLKKDGASLAITVVTLNRLGFAFDEIDEVLKKSEAWDGKPIDLTNLFFDYIELDDDLV